MPTQPPHQVSSLAFRISSLFRISSFGFSISPDLSGRIMRNEPNLPHHQASRHPTFQRNEPNLPPRPPRLCETNPISARPTTQMRKTSPIPAAKSPTSAFGGPNMQNEPNSRPAEGPNSRNEPNSSLPGVQPPTPHPQKHETNPISSCWLPKIRETNPIPAEIPNLRTTNHQLRTKICKTNPICRAITTFRTPAFGPMFLSAGYRSL